jgi:hypothetical protein
VVGALDVGVAVGGLVKLARVGERVGKSVGNSVVGTGNKKIELFNDSS